MDTISLLWASLLAEQVEPSVSEVMPLKCWADYADKLIDAYLDAGDQATHDFLRELVKHDITPLDASYGFWASIDLTHPGTIHIKNGPRDFWQYGLWCDAEVFYQYFRVDGNCLGIEDTARQAVEHAALARHAWKEKRGLV